MATRDRDIAVVGIRENFKFLTLEVGKLVEDTQRALLDPRESLHPKIAARDDYVDNLKSMIENKCFRLLADEDLDKAAINLIRAVNVATINLERIADFAVNILGQLAHIRDLDVLHSFDADPFFAEVLSALEVAEDALFQRDMSKALELCRAEVEVDELYEAVFRQIMDRLRAGHGPEDLVTSLFIYRYLERAGDSLLNIGEAAIFAILGERLRINEFQALQESLANADLDLDLADAELESAWETRSGSRVGMVHKAGKDGRSVVFKEGRTKKVLEEKLALERWEQLEPGLPPRVFSYHDHGPKASLLLEYLRGDTLQRILLDTSPRIGAGAQGLLLETIGRVWSRTIERQPCAPRFMRQINKRLADVLKIHPEFQTPTKRIGTLEISSLEALLARAESLDAELVAPFKVLIHGDFNTDNVIVNAPQHRVHLIDLHRSRPFDYLQDVSVFIISNFRIKIFDPTLRRRLDQSSRSMFRFARAFAREHDDPSFHARLALGLARSLLTSTRFEADPAFSWTLAARARYLLERLLAFRAESGSAPLDARGWSSFAFDEATLYV